VPGEIVAVYQSDGLRMGKVDFGGVTLEVCLEYVPEAVAGDYAVVHVGFALSVLSAAEANETLEMLREMARLEDELGPEARDAAPA